jgi:PKHD-type hydroxylase
LLLTIPDVLTADELQTARKLLHGARWADGKVGAGEQAVRVKNNEQLPHDCEAAMAIRSMVLQGLDRSPLFFSATLPKRVFPPRVNRYGGGSNFYGNHVDGAVRFLPDSGQRVRTDVSCTVFLSDPAEYDGGELCIAGAQAGQSGQFGQGGQGEQAIKLPAGHLVLYPGTHVHQVKPVTRGHRLACFFWIESMVRRDDQRRLLYELDMSLLALRQTHGDSPETTALTGTYHNLLRMWADT